MYKSCVTLVIHSSQLCSEIIPVRNAKKVTEMLTHFLPALPKYQKETCLLILLVQFRYV